jgi:hypothetical protein
VIGHGIACSSWPHLIRASSPAREGRGSDSLPDGVRATFLSALVKSLERDELLRALGSAIEGLLCEVQEVDELAAKVEPELRQLTIVGA